MTGVQTCALPIYTKKPIDIFYNLDEEGNRENELYESIHLILANVRDNQYNVDKEIKNFARLLRQKTTIEELEKEFKGEKKYMRVIETIKRLFRDPDYEFGNTLESRHRDQLRGEREVALEEGGIEGAKTNALETARKLLSKMSVQEVCDITNLSIEEVENLK